MIAPGVISEIEDPQLQRFMDIAVHLLVPVMDEADLVSPFLSRQKSAGILDGLQLHIEGIDRMDGRARSKHRTVKALSKRKVCGRSALLRRLPHDVMNDLHHFFHLLTLSTVLFPLYNICMRYFNDIPMPVRKVLRILNEHHHEAFLVGGCVRDALLNLAVHDHDIATDARPEEMIALFSGRCRIIPTGIQHGTLTLIMDDETIEVTTYRIESGYHDHRRPDAVRFTTDLLQDLCRRDFTINAMAMHPDLGIIDPFHGEEDLRNGIVRCVGCPAQRLQEDALRILRAVRFSCTLHLTLEDTLQQAIREHAPLLAHISRERVAKELSRILMSDHLGLLAMLQELNLMPWTFPQLIPLDPLTDLALDRSRGFTLSQKLALIHLGLDQPEQKAEAALRGLHLPKALIKETCALIRCYPIPVPAQARGLRHLLSRCGYDYGFVRRLIQIQQAGMHIQTNSAPMRMLEEMEARNERFTLKELALSGNDLNMIGIRGKAAGDTLKLLLDHVLDHPEDNDKKTLMRLAEQHISGSD